MHQCVIYYKYFFIWLYIINATTCTNYCNSNIVCSNKVYSSTEIANLCFQFSTDRIITDNITWLWEQAICINSRIQINYQHLIISSDYIDFVHSDKKYIFIVPTYY